MLNDQNEEPFYKGVELVRKINRSAADKYVGKGLSFDQIGIGAMYSAFDIAERMAIIGGNVDRRDAGIAAVEWMRTALDVIERSLMNDGART